MRSLMTKLVLAFLLTSVASVLLASIIIRQLVTREFNDYVFQQQRDSFVANVRTYYETNDSLTGIEAWIRQSSKSTLAITSVDTPAAPYPGDPNVPANVPANSGPSDSQPSVQRRILAPVQFGLVDATGVVIMPFNNTGRGERVDPNELSRGTSVIGDGQVIATVFTAGPEAFRSIAEEQYLARTDLALIIAAVVMIGVALLLGIFLARLITRPVRELTTAAGKIATGDLKQRVPVRSRDELGMLADQFNHMSSNLARATQLRRQMTADIAHDLRTPLTVISGYVEALRDQVLKPTPERFSMMHDEIQLLRHLVEDLHTLSLADAGELHLDRQFVAPQMLLGRVADAYQHAAEQQGIMLHVRVDERLPDICVDAEHMIRALGNLVSNALRYTNAGGQVTLLARAAPAQVQLVVADTGAGIAPEHLPNIFERSYRADIARQRESGGSGLGLAIVKSIVEAHGGQVKAESTLGQGTMLTIALPLR
ncbi:MAG: ATP-binding protein [Chloroflexi bacterium]|nr:ATP-binding protein [Chloroflexota bacterium]